MLISPVSFYLFNMTSRKCKVTSMACIIFPPGSAGPQDRQRHTGLLTAVDPSRKRLKGTSIN